MRVESWKIWYVGGATKCSDGCAVRDLPNDGVIYWRLYYDERHPAGPPQSRNMSGADYYFWQPAEFSRTGREIYGTFMASEYTPETFLQRYPGSVILRGMYTDEDDLHRIHTEAMGQHEYEPCKGC